MKWQQSGVEPIAGNTETFNEAVRLLANALPLRTAARLALTAAETVDQALEQISPDLAQAIEASGQSRVLWRSLHRGGHLDEIEHALQAHPKRM